MLILWCIKSKDFSCALLINFPFSVYLDWFFTFGMLLIFSSISLNNIVYAGT